MRLELSVNPLPDLPAPSGPHELAWSYLLDAIFADAFTQRVAVLHLDLPHESLYDDVTLRTELTPTRPDERGRAVALLGGSHSDEPDELDKTVRLYTLSFGRLAPRSLQKRRHRMPASYQQIGTLGAFSLAARLWGIPIRLAQLAHRPNFQDQAIFAMRRDFSRYGFCYYRLSTWAER